MITAHPHYMKMVEAENRKDNKIQEREWPWEIMLEQAVQKGLTSLVYLSLRGLDLSREGGCEYLAQSLENDAQNVAIKIRHLEGRPRREAIKLVKCNLRLAERTRAGNLSAAQERMKLYIQHLHY